MSASPRRPASAAPSTTIGRSTRTRARMATSTVRATGPTSTSCRAAGVAGEGMDHRTGAAKIVIVAAIVAAAVLPVPGDETPAKKPEASGPAVNADSKEPAAPGSLHFLPKSRRMSTYNFDARFEITARDISFEAPDAYKDGFNFW